MLEFKLSEPLHVRRARRLAWGCVPCLSVGIYKWQLWRSEIINISLLEII